MQKDDEIFGLYKKKSAQTASVFRPVSSMLGRVHAEYCKARDGHALRLSYTLYKQSQKKSLKHIKFMVQTQDDCTLGENLRMRSSLNAASMAS